MMLICRVLLVLTVVGWLGCGAAPEPEPDRGPAVDRREVTPPPGPPIEERPLYAASALARGALEAGDWAAAKEHLEAALAHAPDLPQTRLRLAEVTLRQGDPGSAVEHLRALLMAGAKVDLAESEVFQPFLDIPEVAAFARALHPAGIAIDEGPVATVLATLPGDHWPEGIAVDPATGDIYAGSLERHHILRVAPDGTVADFVRDDHAELSSLVGMAIDSDRRHLWVAAGAGSDQPRSDVPRSNGLVQYQLDTGERLGLHVLADDPERQRLLNDVAVAPDGTVYATESFESTLWRLPPGGELHRWRTFPDLAYLNGLAITASGSALWAVSVEGLTLVDLATGSAHRVRSYGRFAGLGDGMARLDDSLVIVQNDDILGQRVARFDFQNGGRDIVAAKVLAFDWPAGLIPYTVAVDDHQIVVVATADLGLRGSPEQDTVPSPVLLRLARQP